MEYYKIGQQIRKIRKVRQLSQEELAEQVGISTTHMSLRSQYRRYIMWNTRAHEKRNRRVHRRNFR